MCQRYLADGVEHDSAETTVHTLKFLGRITRNFAIDILRKKYAAKDRINIRFIWMIFLWRLRF